MINAIVDFRADKTIKALLNMGFNVIQTPVIKEVYNSISGHPDIVIHKTDKKSAYCAPHYVDFFKSKLPDIEINSGKSTLKADYPYDIAYNIARVGNHIFCLKKYTDSMILEQYYNRGYKIINTRQGYAKCSICVISDNAIITSDKNISIAAEKNNIEVLLVDDKKVKLRDFDHGFIGGATGLTDGKLFINGNTEHHTNRYDIEYFCARHDVEIVSLHDGCIEDIGSIIFI